MGTPSRYTDAEREAAYLARMESTAALAAWANLHGVPVKAARLVAHRWGDAHGLPTPTRAPSKLAGADLTRPTAELVREYGVTASRVIQERTARGVPAPPRPVKPLQPPKPTPKPRPVVETPAPPVKARGATRPQLEEELAEIANPSPVIRVGPRFAVDARAYDAGRLTYDPTAEPDPRWLRRFEAKESRARGTNDGG